MASPYEQKRQENIKRNQALLATLGISSVASKISPPPPKPPAPVANDDVCAVYVPMAPRHTAPANRYVMIHYILLMVVWSFVRGVDGIWRVSSDLISLPHTPPPHTHILSPSPFLRVCMYAYVQILLQLQRRWNFDML
jgi:hypothetical protein